MKRFVLLLAVLMLLPLCAMAVTRVPDGVTVVENDAFAYTGIDALIIPASVERLGSGVLSGGNASYLYLEGADTALASTTAQDVPFIFAPAASAAASLPGFYATENLVVDSGLYYAVTDTALPLCPQEPFAFQGSVTIPKLLGGVPVTSLDVLYLSNTGVTELLVPAYLTLPEGMTASTYQTMSIGTPTASVTQSPAGSDVTWTTTAPEGAYGEVTYLWTFSMNDDTDTVITAEPEVSYAPVAAGSCTVTVTAVDALGDEATSAASEAVVITAGEVQYRALLVGNTYPGESNYLAGCDTDIAGMKTMLSAMTGTAFTVSQVQNVTAGGIRTAIAEAFANAGPLDVSLFYYSGHGNSDGSLVGTSSTLLTVYALRTALQEVPGTKIVILDCCHSGAVINRSISTSDTEAFNNAVISAFASQSRSSENLEDAGYIVLTACRKDQESNSLNDGTTAFGAFTYSLCYGSGYDEWNGVMLDNLPADADGNGAITLGEAYSGAVSRVEWLNSLVGGALDQSVQYYGDTSFVLWSK